MRPDQARRLDFAVHTAPLPAGGTEIAVFGELDFTTAAQVREVLEQVLGGDGEVVVDLRACAFIDSSGLAALAGAALRLKEEGRHLVIRGVRDRVRRTFEIAGLTSQGSLTIEPSPGAHPPG
jgi:anti-sigma B factor antagonist